MTEEPTTKLTTVVDRASPGDLLAYLSGTIPDEMCREFLTQTAAMFQKDLDNISRGRKVLQLTMQTNIRVLVATPTAVDKPD
jgi:hypothetical protein